MGVADVVEAMCSHRPYRPALGIERALEEISNKRGILYDPEVVDSCLLIYEETPAALLGEVSLITRRPVEPLENLPPRVVKPARNYRPKKRQRSGPGGT